MFSSEVFEVCGRLTGCVAALLTRMRLAAALLVRVLQGKAVHLAAVRLERAALGEGLLTVVALVRPYA